jgi:hypothetical protein
LFRWNLWTCGWQTVAVATDGFHHTSHLQN